MKKPLSELNGFTSHTEVTGFEAAPDVKIGSIGQGRLQSWQAMAQEQCIVMTSRVGLIRLSFLGSERNVKTKLRNVRSSKGRWG